MVHMAEDGHNRRTRGQGCFVFIGNHLPPQWHIPNLFLHRRFLIFHRNFKTHFVSQNSSGIIINRLVDACHHTVGH